MKAAPPGTDVREMRTARLRPCRLPALVAHGVHQMVDSMVLCLPLGVRRAERAADAARSLCWTARASARTKARDGHACHPEVQDCGIAHLGSGGVGDGLARFPPRDPGAPPVRRVGSRCRQAGPGSPARGRLRFRDPEDDFASAINAVHDCLPVLACAGAASAKRGCPMCPNGVSGCFNVPVTDTPAIGRAQLARTSFPAAGTGYGLSAVTSSRSEGVQSRRDLRLLSAREPCIRDGLPLAHAGCITGRLLFAPGRTPSRGPHCPVVGASAPSERAACLSSLVEGAPERRFAPRRGMPRLHPFMGWRAARQTAGGAGCPSIRLSLHAKRASHPLLLDVHPAPDLRGAGGGQANATRSMRRPTPPRAEKGKQITVCPEWGKDAPRVACELACAPKGCTRAREDADMRRSSAPWVAVMRSMPSSGSSALRGRDSAPVCGSSRLSAFLNVPATDTPSTRRAQLARSGASIAAPCGGLIAATRVRRARVHARHDLHPTSARRQSAVRPSGVPFRVSADSRWNTTTPRLLDLTSFPDVAMFADMCPEISARYLTGAKPAEPHMCLSACTRPPRGRVHPRPVTPTRHVTERSRPSAREVCIQTSPSAREACIQGGLSATRTPCIQTTLSARRACIQSGFRSPRTPRSAPLGVCIQPSPSAREACIQPSLSARRACIRASLFRSTRSVHPTPRCITLSFSRRRRGASRSSATLGRSPAAVFACPPNGGCCPRAGGCAVRISRRESAS